MLIKPQGKQIEILGLPTKGHFVILGTAGSGKTTIALLRALNLANLPRKENVLLVTFNKALVEYIKDLDNCPDNLTVEHYHKFARGYLGFRNKIPSRNGIIKKEEREVLIDQAVKHYKDCYPAESTFMRNNSFYYDEIKFIEEFGCDTKEKYLEIERTGRSNANLKKEKRPLIYDIYTMYLQLREKKNKCYDWYDVALYVCKELEKDNTSRMYKHIVVDEGQDFSPMMLKSLVKAIPSDGSFTFFGDVAQQIYGNRVSWRYSGVNISKIWQFDINYRNPKTISDFSKELTKSKYWKKNEYMVECQMTYAEGPKPVLIKFSNIDKERDWVVNRSIKESKNSSVVIICRNRNDINDYKLRLSNKGCSAIVINGDTVEFGDKKRVYLSTYHSVKGLEFYNVFIPGLSEDKLPEPKLIENVEDLSEVYSDELKLLYVAVTRSKYGLYMSYSGKLTKLIPNNISTIDLREV